MGCDECGKPLGGSRYTDGESVVCYSCKTDADDPGVFERVRQAARERPAYQKLAGLLPENVGLEADDADEADEDLAGEVEQSEVLTSVESAEGSA